MKHAIPTLLMVAFVVSACADSQTAEDPPAAWTANQQLGPLGGGGAPPSSLDERGLALGQAYFAVDGVLRTADSWKSADRQLSVLAEQGSPVDQWAVEQTAATHMLSTFFLNGPGDREAAQAALRYTETVVEAGTPDAALVAGVLQRYRSHWESADVQHIAERAAASGRKRIAKLSDCGADCVPTSQDPEVAKQVIGQQAVSLQKLTDGVRELEALAQRQP